MRKVKYPLQLDVTDIVTDELRTKLEPITASVKQLLKDRDDRARSVRMAQGKSSEGEREEDFRRKEKAAFSAMLTERGLGEASENPSGMYKLCGMVTHKGPSADSGHYIGWTLKEGAYVPSGAEEWYKFDDDRVSVVTAEKVGNMDGGGEDSVAYILLYRAIDI